MSLFFLLNPKLFFRGALSGGGAFGLGKKRKKKKALVIEEKVIRVTLDGTESALGITLEEFAVWWVFRNWR